MPVDDTGSGSIAGAIAVQGDVEIVGAHCAECSFGSETLTFRKTPSLISDVPSAMAIIASVAPIATVHAVNRYQQRLDAGSYLVCAADSCVGADVLPDHTTTVHMVRGGAEPFLIFDPGSQTVRRPAALSLTPSSD